MEYQSSAESSKSLLLNLSALLKYVAMLVLTPSEAEITGKRSFSETIEKEDEDYDSIKRPRLDSSKELVES